MTKKERTIKIDEKCNFVKNLKNKFGNDEDDLLLKHARKAKMSFKNQINELEDIRDNLFDVIDDAKSSLPLDVNEILDAEDNVALAERRLDASKKLYKELFNEDL